MIGTERPVDPSIHLLTTFKLLNVRITLDKHLDDMNPCIIEDTNQIEGLSTALLYTNSTLAWTQNDTPSKIFAKNLEKNNKLRHLEVSLGLHNSIRRPDDATAIKEQTQGLIYIGRAVPELKHLSLQGVLSFGNEGWAVWSRIWPKLESLSLTGDGIIQEFVKQGPELPSLKSLVVDRRVLGPAPNAVIRNMTKSVEIDDNIGSFLLSLRLHRLSIVGCSANVLANINSSDASLRSLCFHQDMIPPLGTANAQKWLRAEDLQNEVSRFKDLEWFALDVQPFHLSDQIDAAEGVRVPTMGQTPEDLHIAQSLENTKIPYEPQIRSLMAGREQQQYLQRLQLARTEALSRIAARSQQTTLAPVQIPPNNRLTGGICHIPSAPPRLADPLHDDHFRMLNLQQTETNIRRTQRVQQLHQLRQEDSEPEHIRTYLENIFSSAGAHRIADIFEDCCSSIEEAQSVFQALASMPKLIHLRLFIHKSILLSSGRESRPWVLSTTDAIYTFLYFRRRKNQGRKLQSLVVFSCDQNKKSAPHMCWYVCEFGEDKVCVSNVSTRQVWDVSNYENLRPVERRKVLLDYRDDWWIHARKGDSFIYPHEWLGVGPVN
jgi:hypothetical protein